MSSLTIENSMIMFKRLHSSSEIQSKILPQVIRIGTNIFDE